MKVFHPLLIAAAVALSGPLSGALADGADPFAGPGLLPAVCCRLYRDEYGRQVPSPSAAQLRAALGL